MSVQRIVREAVIGCGILLSLPLGITAAGAFTPEPVQSPPGKPQAQSSTVQGSGSSAVKPQAELNDTMTAGKSKGTDVTIPGIGSVGTLPKMDFGLELLYGPQGPGSEALKLDQRAPEGRGLDNDVQIRGSLTHKF